MAGRSSKKLALHACLSLFLVCVAIDSFAQDHPDGDLQITSISPSGSNVPAGQRIAIHFNHSVVPIGRMDRDASRLPITITPNLPCKWRWMDRSSLVCQLRENANLRLATRYTVQVEPEIPIEDGATLSMAFSHSFVTERARVVHTYFKTWRSPGMPILRVVFNQPVSETSVRHHLFIQADTRISVAIEPDEDDRETPRLMPLPGEPALIDFGAPQSQASDDQLTEIAGEQARRVWLVSPRQELAADKHAALVVEPGLISAEGLEPSDEARTIVEFDTFPEYRLIGLVCRTNHGQEMLIRSGDEADQRHGRSGLCGPLRSAGLAFSSPTLNGEVRDHVTITPDLAGGRTDYDPWANRREYSRLGRPHLRGKRYIVWLPETLKAATDYRVRSTAAAPPRDEFGRMLAEPIELDFDTDHRPPSFTIAHRTAVLESETDSEVPLYVTNLDRATLHYRRLTAAGSTDGLTVTKSFPEIEDIQYAVTLGVREMLEGKTGAIYGQITTNPYVDRHPFHRTLFAQITPYQVHVKLGHFNTLVWVTDLATGKPVKDAEVSIYVDRLAQLSAEVETLDEARTDSHGVAMLNGTWTLDPELRSLEGRCKHRNWDQCPRLFVRVQSTDRIALLPLEWRFEASPARVSNYTVFPRTLRRFGHLHSWGTTAQGIYRAGDTIDFKIYVRDQSNESYVPAPAGPYSLKIIDPTGKAVHVVRDIELSTFGAFHGAYEVPEFATLGWYRFELEAGFAKLTRAPMRVLVTDFAPASFRVTTMLNGDTFVAGAEVIVETRATLFSGGPYGNAEARVAAAITKRVFSSDHPLAASFHFDRVSAPQTLALSQFFGEVGAEGEIEHRFTVPDNLGEKIVHGILTVDSAVRDDRGRYVAGFARSRYLAVDRLVGLKNTRWVYTEDEPASIEFIVVGTDGAAAAGTEVHVDVRRLETKAARVKGAGNAYLTQFVNRWVDVASCDLTSTVGPGECGFVPDKPGRYEVSATIADTVGRIHKSQINSSVTGKQHVVWNTGNDDRLHITPERTRYRIGETARYLIQNPYPGARALITVERYGVLKQWVETLDDSTPLIEFQIEKDFLPGFYLSMVLVSPRVAAPLPGLGEVDLGKPAFKGSSKNPRFGRG